MKKLILIIILIMAIFQMVAISANLFADGFEGGNTAAWSDESDAENDLTVATGAAALHGTYGLSAFIDNTTPMYVKDLTPNAEKRYRCRFYIDPNGLAMANNDEFLILCCEKTEWVTSFFINLLYTTAAGYQIYLSERGDIPSWYATSKYAITDAPHCIEVDWKASSGAGQNNGTIELLIDGVSKQTLISIDNDTEDVTVVYLGVFQAVDAGTLGTFFLDDFASNNDGSEIGVIAEAPAGNAIMMGINL